MFNKILVPVDPAEPGFSSAALTKASRLAKDYGATLHLLAVCPPVQSFVASQLPADFQEREVDETEVVLKGLVTKTGLADGMAETEVRIGPVDHTVIDAAEECSADLIVMTSHKPGFSTYFVGSHAAHIVRHASCSVLVLRS